MSRGVTTTDAAASVAAVSPQAFFEMYLSSVVLLAEDPDAGGLFV